MADTALVLFDLDGTLVDTAPDMAAALDALLVDEGHEPLPFERVRPHVSRGAAGLLELGFGGDIEPGRMRRLREAFLEHYGRVLTRASRPFPGIPELLERIEAAGLSWGVVTNKPAGLTGPLLEALSLSARAATVVSGDTLARRKPDPAPLLFACSAAGVTADRTVYVGDDERDVVAGIAAGLPVYVALWGYIGHDLAPARWGGAATIDSPLALWPHVRPARPPAAAG